MKSLTLMLAFLPAEEARSVFENDTVFFWAIICPIMIFGVCFMLSWCVYRSREVFKYPRRIAVAYLLVAGLLLGFFIAPVQQTLTVLILYGCCILASLVTVLYFGLRSCLFLAIERKNRYNERYPLRRPKEIWELSVYEKFFGGFGVELRSRTKTKKQRRSRRRRVPVLAQEV